MTRLDSCVTGFLTVTQICLFIMCPDQLGGYIQPSTADTEVPSLEVKWLGCDANHSHPSSAED